MHTRIQPSTNRPLWLKRCAALALAAAVSAVAVGAPPEATKPGTPPTETQGATPKTPSETRPDQNGQAAKKADKPAPEKPAEKTPPGLKVGDAAPGDARLIGADEKPVLLKDLWKDGPVVITFYRGGWCPFCTKALSGWQEKMSDLKAAGATFVAVTPETPQEVKHTQEKTALDARVLVDSKSEAGKGFKVHFELDAQTQQKYKGYGIDLAKRNQNQKWELDAPATFVIDTKGVVRYAFADWDYTKRADPDTVIAAVKGLAEAK